LQGEDASFYATTMFVRFRQQARRLQVSLVQNRRVAGKVRAEHIGALGSVDANISVRCQSASKSDPRSASKIDPSAYEWRGP
jgi:hypothetical protein